ncbi:hypothetical protein KCU92_g102, partial [Aureobasidium melanogenum]
MEGSSALFIIAVVNFPRCFGPDARDVTRLPTPIILASPLNSARKREPKLGPIWRYKLGIPWSVVRTTVWPYDYAQNIAGDSRRYVWASPTERRTPPPFYAGSTLRKPCHLCISQAPDSGTPCVQQQTRAVLHQELGSEARVKGREWPILLASARSSKRRIPQQAARDGLEKWRLIPSHWVLNRYPARPNVPWSAFHSLRSFSYLEPITVILLLHRDSSLKIAEPYRPKEG